MPLLMPRRLRSLLIAESPALLVTGQRYGVSRSLESTEVKRACSRGWRSESCSAHSKRRSTSGGELALVRVPREQFKTHGITRCRNWVRWDARQRLASRRFTVGRVFRSAAVDCLAMVQSEHGPRSTCTSTAHQREAFTVPTI